MTATEQKLTDLEAARAALIAAIDDIKRAWGGNTGFELRRETPRCHFWMGKVLRHATSALNDCVTAINMLKENK